MTQDEVNRLLLEALKHSHGTHTLVDVLSQVAQGALKLWVGKDSVAITEFVRFPQRTALNVFLAAGNMDELRETAPGLEAFARGGGANAIMFQGRISRDTAWARYWPDYDPSWTCFWKDL